jgi:hypothetical protein
MMHQESASACDLEASMTFTVQEKAELTYTRDPMDGPAKIPSEPWPKVDHFIGNLEMWYAADFERRLEEATELLRAHITKDLLAQFNAELESQVENARREYDEQLKSRTQEWESDRSSMKNEIDRLLERPSDNDFSEEIARTEAAIRKCSSELESLRPDDSAGMARLLQQKTEQLELRAYLRGLQYRSRKPSESTTPRGTSDPIQKRPINQMPPLPPPRKKTQWPSLEPSYGAGSCE